MIKRIIKDEKLKKIVFYLFFFFFLFFFNMGRNLYGDELWNYGFSHNIYNGLLPYKDFNMVITPLYPFLTSLPFHIFGSSMALFILEHVCLMLLLFSLVFKILNKDRAYFFIIFLFSPFFFFPGYNTFSFFLLCLIIYLEVKKENDYLIGIILALLFLTKQSIGVMLLFPSLYYLKDLKKVGRRIIGFLIPNMVFLIYLIYTKTLYNFLDLCLFGLFDFAGDNNGVFSFSFFLSIFVFIIDIYFVYKNKRNIMGYYSLAFLVGIIVPLFDYGHLYYGFCAVLLFILSVTKKRLFNEKLLLAGIILFFIFCNLDEVIFAFSFDNKVAYFENKNLGISQKNMYKLYDANKFVEEHKDNVVILANDAYLLKISSDTPITHTDLINRGNFGYNSTKKMLHILKSKKDTYFLIEKYPFGQTDKKLIDYIHKNAKKIDEVGVYDVYYK